MSKPRAISRSRAICRLALLVILAAPLFAYSEPRYHFGTTNLSITLHDELCGMKDEVTNLPRRAVWKDKGVETEGCWGFSEQFGLVLMYFKDKTATALPAALFTKVTGI